MYYSRKDEIERLKEEGEGISFKEFKKKFSSYIKNTTLESVSIDSRHTGLQKFGIPDERKKLEIVLKMNKDRTLKVDGSPIFKAYFEVGKIYLKDLMAWKSRNEVISKIKWKLNLDEENSFGYTSWSHYLSDYNHHISNRFYN